MCEKDKEKEKERNRKGKRERVCESVCVIINSEPITVMTPYHIHGQARIFESTDHYPKITTSLALKLLQFLTQLLDEFLVLVELLECLDVHAWDAISLGLITVRGITQHTHLKLRTRNVTKPRIQHNIMCRNKLATLAVGRYYKKEKRERERERRGQNGSQDIVL